MLQSHVGDTTRNVQSVCNAWLSRWKKTKAASTAKSEAYNTRCSQAVTHPGTDLARPCLTAVIRREPVYSWWYGRRRKLEGLTCMTIQTIHSKQRHTVQGVACFQGLSIKRCWICVYCILGYYNLASTDTKLNRTCNYH